MRRERGGRERERERERGRASREEREGRTEVEEVVRCIPVGISNPRNCCVSCATSKYIS